MKVEPQPETSHAYLAGTFLRSTLAFSLFGVATLVLITCRALVDASSEYKSERSTVGNSWSPDIEGMLEARVSGVVGYDQGWESTKPLGYDDGEGWLLVSSGKEWSVDDIAWVRVEGNP